MLSTLDSDRERHSAGLLEDVGIENNRHPKTSEERSIRHLVEHQQLRVYCIDCICIHSEAVKVNGSNSRWVEM